MSYGKCQRTRQNFLTKTTNELAILWPSILVSIPHLTCTCTHHIPQIKNQLPIFSLHIPHLSRLTPPTTVVVQPTTTRRTSLASATPSSPSLPEVFVNRTVTVGEDWSAPPWPARRSASPRWGQGWRRRWPQWGRWRLRVIGAPVGVGSGPVEQRRSGLLDAAIGRFGGGSFTYQVTSKCRLHLYAGGG